MENTTPQRVPLTPAEAQKIGGALQRLSEIGSSVIVSPRNEAEQKALISWLQTTLLQHADQLLASWAAVQYEYEPLIQGFSGLLSRSQGLLKMRAASMAQAEQPERTEKESPAPDEGAPSNVIPLTR